MIEVAGGETKIIAEDLGIIPQAVVDLRLRFNLRGMAILQFGFSDDSTENPHHPSNINDMQIVYTGTHDNNTLLGWWKSSDDGIKSKVRAVIGNSQDVVGSLIELAKNSAASLCVIPLQDILRLDASSRMNVPGVEQGNWQWRFSWGDLK